MADLDEISNPEKILVVEDPLDNLNNQELLSVLLSFQGYQVESGVSQNMATTIAKVRPPDLILIDISKLESVGFQLCQQLKADPETHDIPIIFISSLENANIKIKAFESGGNDYITKPFQIEEVLARVNNQLQCGRLKSELKARNTLLEQELHKRQLIERKLLDLNQKLGKLAAIDSLTQIANRRIFDEFIVREWQRAQREQHELGLILCDIDYFKRYNDHFGHQRGDVCLQKVAQEISQTVKRPADLVARYGGEEFAIILPQTPAHNALQVAKAIAAQVRKLGLPHPNSSVSDVVSLSLGVASLIPQTKFNQQQLIFFADQALYQAKKQGRDRAVLAVID